jgi:hypothetical protein
MAATAQVGRSIYAQTVFPVLVNNRIAIPQGTTVQGEIDGLQLPGVFTWRATFQIHFTAIIFANGYTLDLTQQPGGSEITLGVTSAPNDVYTAVATPYVLATRGNDVLLDNREQIKMEVQLSLRLDAASVAEAVRNFPSKAPTSFKSATQCRPRPGTPGTSDTVIPGSPGMPGTPPTVIPGVNGMPDTVIPGTPPMPPTPPTVIPGTPGTPGTACPGPPAVTTNPKPQSYKQNFQIATDMQVSGKPLPAGSYQATWKGTGLSVQVEIRQNGKMVVSVPARFVLLNGKSPSDAQRTQKNSDGSVSLVSLRFTARTFALYFS